MRMFVEPTNASVVPCPYIDGEDFIQRYTVLNDLTPEDFDYMLRNGWRHFGYYFFMPNCLKCNKCRPIRTLVSNFKPSKSQRRNLKKNRDRVSVEFKSLVFSEEVYAVYKKHSLVKFNQETNLKEFKESFFSDALMGNSILSLYRVNGKLVGVGFLDISKEALSSIYFCYDTDFSPLGLGVYSVLKEIEYGGSLGKEFYYLGYYIKENQSMEYKAKYTPFQLLNWDKGIWE